MFLILPFSPSLLSPDRRPGLQRERAHRQPVLTCQDRGRIDGLRQEESGQEFLQFWGLGHLAALVGRAVPFHGGH